MTPAERRSQLYSMLGELPARTNPIRVISSSEEAKPGFVLERLLLDLNGEQPVPAYFARPLSGGRRPTIIYMHAHGGEYSIGKAEILDGRTFMPCESYAAALTRAGYNLLCIDQWCFGERALRSEAATFKLMLWRGQVLWGMMLYDCLRAIDYAVSRSDVDASRLATLGMSMGSTLSYWTAALDPRVKVCIDTCCLSEYQPLIDTGAFDIHAFYYYVPGLLNHFTAADVSGLIAPRPHLSLAGTRDRLTPVAGLDAIDGAMRRVYADHGAPDAWRQSRYDVEHIETQPMRDEIMAFLAKWL